MIGRDLVPQTEDSRDASFVRVESSAFSYAQLPEHNSYLVYSTCGSIRSPKEENT